MRFSGQLRQIAEDRKLSKEVQHRAALAQQRARAVRTQADELYFWAQGLVARVAGRRRLWLGEDLRPPNTNG